MAPPLTRAALEAIEKEMGVALPEEYARHLLEVADGGEGPPAYGLYSLAEAVAESRAKGIYALADPFEPPLCEGEYVDLEAPGMLLIGHQGCAFWDGLVLAGPEVGTVWTFVEVRPGWVPVLGEGPLKRADGAPYKWTDNDYAGYYDVALHEVNRPHRLTFGAYYRRWLGAQETVPEGTEVH